MSKLLSAQPEIERSATAAAKINSFAIWLNTGINDKPIFAFVCLTLFYVIAIITMSSFKLLWLDELITLHIARLDGVSSIWRALAAGADPNPPLTHFLVHFCRQFFGEHELALRIPAACGYWIGLLSLYLYLRVRIPATWALGGAALSMTMAAFDYSYESRSYAIFYGFAMLAVFCWSRTVNARRASTSRYVALFGMTFALAAGICTNYFAVLAFFPIAGGEITRVVRRAYDTSQWGTTSRSVTLWRAMDLDVWLGMVIAATPLLLFRSMIAHSIAQFAPFAWNKVSLNQVFDSYTEMVEVVLYPLLALLLAGIIVPLISRLNIRYRSEFRLHWRTILSHQNRSAKLSIPLHEVAAIALLLAYPFLGYIVASIRGGMLSPRFVIPVCFGFAIAGTLVAYKLFGHVRQAGVIALCFWLVWFVSRESVVGYWYVEQKQSFYKVVDHLPEAERSVPSGAPIVIPDPLMALTFQHYVTPALATRIIFPIDFPATRLYRHDDSPEENLWAGRNSLYTLPIVPLAGFQHSARQYLIIAGEGNWLVEDLLQHHYPVPRLPINTRAGAIGGFTPLSHGTPVFFTSAGDKIKVGPLSVDNLPIPFKLSQNLPGAAR